MAWPPDELEIRARMISLFPPPLWGRAREGGMPRVQVHI